MQAPTSPKPPGFLDSNAGKLVIFAFLAPVPLRVFGVSWEAAAFADLLFLVLLVLGITGYVKRHRRREREKQAAETEGPDGNGR